MQYEPYWVRLPRRFHTVFAPRDMEAYRARSGEILDLMHHLATCRREKILTLEALPEYLHLYMEIPYDESSLEFVKYLKKRSSLFLLNQTPGPDPIRPFWYEDFCLTPAWPDDEFFAQHLTRAIAAANGHPMPLWPYGDLSQCIELKTFFGSLHGFMQLPARIPPFYEGASGPHGKEEFF